MNRRCRSPTRKSHARDAVRRRPREAATESARAEATAVWNGCGRHSVAVFVAMAEALCLRLTITGRVDTQSYYSSSSGCASFPRCASISALRSSRYSTLRQSFIAKLIRRRRWLTNRYPLLSAVTFSALFERTCVQQFFMLFLSIPDITARPIQVL